MKRSFKQSAIFLALLLPALGHAQQSQKGSEPIIPNIDGFHGDIGLRYQTDRRALSGIPSDTDMTLGSSALTSPLEVDFEQIVVKLSARPHPSLTLHAEGGWSEVEIGSEKADGDLIWGLGGKINVLEKALKSTAEHRKKELLRLSVELNYRSTEGEFSTSETEEATVFEFEEFEIIPMLTYERNNDLNLDRSSYAPPGTAGHIGVVLNSVDASLEDFDLEEENSASLLLGFDLRWKSGWMTQFRAILSSDTDRRVGIGARYNF